ncbi:YjfB family protein [Herminiimonas glaciei]|uniref:YjfB family protein n=1 Tax=Herminiimonas glaciei TaxID=523788 RepID=A0ABW2I9H5_9BURK
MDVSNIANLASNLAAQRTSNEVSLTVFKKAMDIQSTTALSLLDAVPKVSLPANVGQNINTKA